MADAVADAGAGAGRDDIGDGDAEIDDDAQDDERPGADDDAERPADLEVPHVRIAPESAWTRSIAQAERLGGKGSAPALAGFLSSPSKEDVEGLHRLFRHGLGIVRIGDPLRGVAQAPLITRAAASASTSAIVPSSFSAPRLRSSSRRSRWRSAIGGIAEHRRAVAKDDALDLGLQRHLDIGGAFVDEALPAGRRALAEATSYARSSRRRSRTMHRLEQALLVAEVMIERAARQPGRRR